ncbi:MAG TPA: ATP-binding protein [Saprospiraceae bacterium]|nr:ATP-binding protein [Saprospiraceae bacterium]
MKVISFRKDSLKKQLLLSTTMIVLSSLILYFFVGWIGYQVVALVLLLMVSISAMLFDIVPVLIAALLSALIWNYFFIPPVRTFHIGTPEDVLMFLMYFVIAFINAVLSFKIREIERKVRDKEEKENTLKLYDTLLNSLSHELRTPIAAIIGAVDILENQAAPPSNIHQSELIDEIKIASLRLNEQVENLLSMNRLESGILKPVIDWVDVNDLIFSVIKNYKTHHSEALNIVFNPDEKVPLIKVDAVFVEQILYNLIRNAHVHTPAKSTVRIAASYLDESIRISVADNGKGFPNDEIKFVFDKFYRLKGAATGGTGLGLSIVKGFVEALNGQITLENQSSGGALFTVVLPAESSTLNLVTYE